MEDLSSFFEDVFSEEKAISQFALMQGITDRAEAERRFYAALERTAPQGQERDGDRQ